MALLGAPVMVALFMLFPRIAPLWGVPGDAMAGRTGVVMAHHGSLTAGATPAQAAARADLLEWLCEVALLARSAGSPAELTGDQLDEVRRAVAARRAGR